MDTYWYRFGYIAEGRGWHERAIRLIDSGSPMDDPGIVDALHGHGLLAVQRNDLTTGAASLRRALEMARRIDDLDREARESNSLGLALLRSGGDDAAGRELILRSLDLARQIGNRHREATDSATWFCSTWMPRTTTGRWSRPRRRPRPTVLSTTRGEWRSTSSTCPPRCYTPRARPSPGLVDEIAQDVLALDDVELSIDMVETMAAIAAFAGDAELAASLLGAADAKREGVGMPRVNTDDALLERFVGPARATVGPARWDPAYRRGRSDSLEEAVARATSVARAARPAGDPGRAAARRVGGSVDPLRRRLDAADSLTGSTRSHHSCERQARSWRCGAELLTPLSTATACRSVCAAAGDARMPKEPMREVYAPRSCGGSVASLRQPDRNVASPSTRGTAAGSAGPSHDQAPPGHAGGTKTPGGADHDQRALHGVTAQSTLNDSERCCTSSALATPPSSSLCHSEPTSRDRVVEWVIERRAD